MFFSFPHIAIDSEGNVGGISRPNRPGEWGWLPLCGIEPYTEHYAAVWHTHALTSAEPCTEHNVAAWDACTLAPEALPHFAGLPAPVLLLCRRVLRLRCPDCLHQPPQG